MILIPGEADAEAWAARNRLRWPAAVPGRPPATLADLLARTALFKAVAAPNPRGLDLMTRPGLVAMLSFDGEFAWRAGRIPLDPAPPDRLLRAARGRLLRSDRPFPERPEGAAAGDWDAFRAATDLDPDGLRIDFRLGGR